MARKKRSFEEALTRIEEIAEELESGSASLEDSVALYKEGVELSLFCRQKLAETAEKVTILEREVDGSLKESPFLEEVQDEF